MIEQDANEKIDQDYYKHSNLNEHQMERACKTSSPIPILFLKAS